MRFLYMVYQPKNAEHLVR